MARHTVGRRQNLWARVAALGKLSIRPVRVPDFIKPHGSGSLYHRVKYRYERARDLFCIGGNPLEGIKCTSYSYPAYIAIVGMAYIRSRFMKTSRDGQGRGFKKTDYIPKGILLGPDGKCDKLNIV